MGDKKKKGIEKESLPPVDLFHTLTARANILSKTGQDANADLKLAYNIESSRVNEGKDKFIPNLLATGQAVSLSIQEFGTNIIIKFLIDPNSKEIEMSCPSFNVELFEIPRPEKIVLPLIIDVQSFFNQSQLPNFTRCGENFSQDDLKRKWKILLSFHPIESVAISFYKIADKPSLGVQSFATLMLVIGTPDVKQVVAKFLWKSDSSMEFVMTILANRGIQHTGITYDEGREAVKLLQKFCPSDKKSYFEKMAADRFGPSFSSEGQKISQSEIASLVKFKRRYFSSEHEVNAEYEVYTAPNKQVAMAFLENYSIQKKYFYVEIETPEGPIGKDICGIY